MATEIWREFDPSHSIPIGLVNARTKGSSGDVDVDSVGQYPDIDPQGGTPIDEASDLNEDYVEGELPVPTTFNVVSQTVRTSPDGSHVVDVIIEIESVGNAIKYEMRLAK